ncbi:MAG: MATE family efflux transporter [Mailhella sp.]|nr:MATE family efflux transporter [Mailhella sp.]
MDKKVKANEMGTKSIGRLLLEYTIPAILGMAIVAVNQIISSVYIGYGVGPLALAAMAVTFPVINLLMAFCQLVAVGCAAMCSIALGRKDMPEARSMLGHCVLLEILLSAVFGFLFWIFLDPMLMFFGASAETLAPAREFMVPLLVFAWVQFLTIGLNFLARASGYPKTAMFTAVMTALGIVVFSPLFIYQWEWGMYGAAMAQVMGSVLSTLWLTVHFLRKGALVHFGGGMWKLKMDAVKRIFSIGMAPFLIYSCACIVVIVINRALLEYGGDLAVGAYGIVNRLLMLFVLCIVGFGQGIQPIIGFNYGAKNKARVRRTLKLSMVAGTSITFMGMLVSLLCPRLMVLMFTDHAPLVELATRAMRLSGSLFVFVGPNVVIGTYFQSIGMAKLASLVSLSRQMICLIPALIILPLFWGLDGVWLSLPFADFMGSVFASAGLYMTLKAEDNDCQKGDPECTPPPDFFKPKQM